MISRNCLSMVNMLQIVWFPEFFCTIEVLTCSRFILNLRIVTSKLTVGQTGPIVRHYGMLKIAAMSIFQNVPGVQ